jgi:hypothetical protein
MIHRALDLVALGWIFLAVAVAMSSHATAAQQETRVITPSTVVMEFPENLGVMQRPAVEFNHAAHSQALEKEGCSTCHTTDEGGLITALTATLSAEDRESLIDAYHSACMDCHKNRAAAAVKSGPVTCGECHVRRPPGVSTRAPMAFDYSLHGRHSVVYEDKCENCHHVYDEVQQKLKYEKGKEEGCSSCHGADDEERKLSLANASHRGCVSCHLTRIDNQLEAGPVLCAGCHDHSSQLAIEKMEEVPRLMRGQPDTAWIAAADASSPAVPFNHQFHEPLTTSCSACHHRTLKPCKDCHTLLGSEEGAGITMAEAYHLVSSEHSCVGCHAQKTDSKECAGCHSTFAHAPSQAACTVCHNGPRAAILSADGPPPSFEKVELSALPATSDDFPENVVIEGLLDKYEASKLPHAKIVGKLHGIVGESTLAGKFHGDTDTLCAGCHHHTPAGTRPPPCRACHSETNDPTRDKPGLKTAYHRQCVGCHIEMGLEQQGCTDCHAAKGEVAS